MNTRKILVIAGAALLLASTSSTVYAQEEDDAGHYFAVSTYQWPFNNLGEIIELMEENQELTEQNEFILSRKVLTHVWGGNFSVMFIVEYASFDDISKAQARGTELFEAKYPDEEDRDARNEEFSALVGDGIHEDNILQENASLTK